MHELSIASSIVDTILKEVDKRKLKSVSLIALEIGALTDIVPDSLLFGFEAITKDTILQKTKLEINIVPIKGSCTDCRKSFEVSEFVFICPNCSSGNIKVEQGNELDIAYIEAED